MRWSIGCALWVLSSACTGSSSDTTGPASGTVSGAVSTNVGGALGGVSVTVTPSNGTALPAVGTSSDGVYAVTGVPAGDGTVAITGVPSGCTIPAPVPYSGVSAGGAAMANMVVTCTPPTGTVSGTVTSTLGGGVSGATIIVTPTNGAALRPVKATTDGSYVVNSVPVAAASGVVAIASVPPNCTAPKSSSYYGLMGGANVTVNIVVFCSFALTPAITAITPPSALTGTTTPVTVTGTNFVPGATTVSVSDSGVKVGPVIVTSPTTLSTSFVIDTTAMIGARDVTVTTTAHGTSRAQTFTINPAEPSSNPWPAPPYRNITGKGVIVAILDRGIQWQHPDFIKPDGKTRIRYMLDMSGQTSCSPQSPAPIEYSASQINAALSGGTPLDTRDAVGHGTVTAGIAAGNGRAAGGGRFAGVAPDADLIIIKLLSEGAPAHDGQPAEPSFEGCYDQALAWLDQKVTALGEPVVALINSGAQGWGPIDGTSALSRVIDKYFSNRPGHIFISPSGDEGGLPNHARGTYSTTPVTVDLSPSSSPYTFLSIWSSGKRPAQITLSFDDGTVVGPLGPGQVYDAKGIVAVQYLPGREFYPVTSTSGDRSTAFNVIGHQTTGHLTIQGLGPGTGRFDLYSSSSPGRGPTTSFDDHLAVGRLSDQASTRSAIVAGASVNADCYTDISAAEVQPPGDVVGGMWMGSSGGPTRDGRLGIDVVAPGETDFGAYATTSYLATFTANLIADGAGFYGRQAATDGAAPILAGTAALMLQINPTLTSDQARALLHSTATSDANTGVTPNNGWGYGKLNIPAVIDQLLSPAPSVKPLRNKHKANPATHGGN